ncbi:MAG: SLC13 family permease [Chlamydiota bacterium]
MTLDQLLIFGILITALILFIFGKWRYDIVACIVLILVALTNTIPVNRIFAGFGHPAVITVAAVLVISRGLQNSGLIDLLTSYVEKVGKKPILQLAVLMIIVMLLSGFMNDVGALALTMPVAIQIARRSGKSPSYLLMPLAFGSLLGGLLTMIGTPPNIIIGTFSPDGKNQLFTMFDFTPVGLAVSLSGLIYVLTIGWKLIPDRKGQTSADELFHIKEYTTEVSVPEGAKVVGKPLSHLEEISNQEVTIIGLVRGKRRLLAPSGFETIWANDVLIVEASHEHLKNFLDKGGLELTGEVEEKEVEEVIKSDEVVIIEAIVSPISSIIKKNAKSLHLRWRHGVNLLAVARHGERLHERLGRIRFEVGDILLLQGPKDSIHETLSLLGCLPLAHRDLRIGQPRRIILSLGIFCTAIALTVAGLLPVQLSFTCAALAMVLFNMFTLSEVYESIEWPVIILLGAMIPLGDAMETTGGAKLIGDSLVTLTSGMPASATLCLLLVITMSLSNVMNNAAVAVLMAPIALSVSQMLQAEPHAFLMSVAVGASSTFLTPIGHQSNALVMGPGGYNFGDYWKLGLILSIIVVLVSVPLLMYLWPLKVG